MSRCSQTEVWRRLRALADGDAGRLRGQCLHDFCTPVPPGTLDSQAAELLQASVYRRQHEPVTPDMVFYVVSSDGTPVAWVTYDAQICLPPAQLSAYQLAHQQQAFAALSQLTRRAIWYLAALRDSREQRSHPQEPTTLDTDGRVLAACPADPTLTFWARVSADVAASLAHLQALTGASGEPLLVDSFGYGNYGRHREHLDLEILCAIEELATEHQLPPCVVGDWLHAEGGSTAVINAGQVREGFNQSYRGVYLSRTDFADAERDARGWTKVFAEQGIALDLFDIRVFASQLFQDEARQFHLTDGRIAVFDRHDRENPCDFTRNN